MVIDLRSVATSFLRSLAIALSGLLIAAAPGFAADAGRPAPVLQTVNIGNGITIHYVEKGAGAPVVFVHGSIGDYSYWDDQIAAFGTRYRAIAYSRRYNYPNSNPARPGYSAVTDADDLAAFIRKLHLGRAYVVGHSYGALTALFLAVRHPELIRALVLAEPPAVTLLRHLPDEQAAKGDKLFADIQSRMVAPMRAAFAKNDREAGVATFINYVFDDSAAWAKMSASARADTMRDAHEWDVMMTSGTLFPEVDPAAIRAIKVPVLVMSGGVSYKFLGYIDQEIVRLIPHSRSIVYPDAGHQMWYKYPKLCRDDTE
ncbi:MAG: alpha/beta fold hydrolase, partial [Gemmataceae bacterium]